MKKYVVGIVCGIIGVIVSWTLFFVQNFFKLSWLTDYRIGIATGGLSVFLLFWYYIRKK